MGYVFIIAGLSFICSIIITPLCRELFRRMDVVDHPDNSRKLHSRAVPLLGGVPLVFSYLVSFVIVKLLGHSAGVNYAQVFRIAPAALIVFGLGVWDDCVELKAWCKLGLQAAASLVAYIEGVRIQGIAGHSFSPWVAAPVTILWLIGCTNAFNLIDGLDGLAAGVGLFATMTTLIAALMQHNLTLAVAVAPLAGALIGFLRYNLNPATIFLGDSGSLLIGFLLGCFGALWSEKSATILGMTAPVMALSIPIFDVCLSIGRRFLRRQPIMDADRGHIHHRLLDRGLSPRRVVLILYGLCGVGAALSLLESVALNHLAGVVVVVFCAAAWVGIQSLGYDEFDEARRMILEGGFREVLNSKLALRTLDQALSTANSQEERWKIIRGTCGDLGFSQIKWRADGIVYEASPHSRAANASWSVQIPLGDEDYVQLTWSRGAANSSVNVNALAAVLRSALYSWSPAPPEPARVPDMRDSEWQKFPRISASA